MLAKRHGDDLDGELLAKGYWRMLGEKLTEAQMSDLTELVLAECKWFPTVAECREMMGRADYANPFYVTRRNNDLARLGYVPEAQKQLTDETTG